MVWVLHGFYVGSAYDSALMAADLKYKNLFKKRSLTDSESKKRINPVLVKNIIL